MRTWSLKHKVIIAAVLGVVLAGIAVWLVWPDAPARTAPRERQYRSTTACLLTDDKGLNGEPAKAAWAGMQEASVATLIKVQYLTIAGPQTTENGLSFFNTLGSQKCAIIVAAGPTPVGAMVAGYSQFPNVKHVAVGGDVHGKPLTTVDATDPNTVQRTVRDIVQATTE